MDDWGRSEVPDTHFWPSIAMGGADVITFRLGVVDGHQPSTCIPSDPKFHGDDTTRFLRTKSHELRRVELHNTRLGIIDDRKRMRYIR